MRTAELKVRIEPELKEEIKKICKEIGLSVSDAVNILLRRMQSKRGIEGDFLVPNAETIAAMEEDFSNKQGQGYSTVEELFAALAAEPDDED
jgi:DNA-damage-inducible protein J